MPAADRSLSTTSYSILGYLAVRPFTAYELTKQLGRTFRHFWPRAESGIYREMKRLVDHGLAAADEESVGRRARTRYTITGEGRQAVRAWLATPVAPGFLESEALVRVLWADQGSRDDLLAVLRGVDDEAAAMRDQMVALTEQYLAGAGDYQDRAHVNALIARFLVDFSVMASAWSAWAAGVVEKWPDTAPRPTDEATLTALRETLAAAGR